MCKCKSLVFILYFWYMICSCLLVSLASHRACLHASVPCIYQYKIEKFVLENRVQKKRTIVREPMNFCLSCSKHVHLHASNNFYAIFYAKQTFTHFHTQTFKQLKIKSLHLDSTHIFICIQLQICFHIHTQWVFLSVFNHIRNLKLPWWRCLSWSPDHTNNRWKVIKTVQKMILDNRWIARGCWWCRHFVRLMLNEVVPKLHMNIEICPKRS